LTIRREYEDAKRRVEKTLADGSSTDFYYNHEWQLLEEREFDAESDPIESHVYVWSARYIDAPILRDTHNDEGELQTSARVYYAGDANNNVTALLDSTGAVIERYVYTAYGSVTFYDSAWVNTHPSSLISNPFLYCGYFFDAETGNHLARHRFYNSALATWISRDPLLFDAGDMNLYCYVGNNPCNRLDPTGERDVTVTGWTFFIEVIPILWDKSKCPTTCEQWYGRGYDEDVIADRANELKKAIGGNIEIVARSSCGGAGGFSLTCDCRGTLNDPNAPTVVCVKKQGTCKTLEILEHELVHAGQIANGKPIDAAAELEAYRKSCEIEATHNCLQEKNCWSDQQLANWINQCAQRKVGGSLGPVNRSQIERGCRTLCQEWKRNNGMRNPLRAYDKLSDLWEK
jgi:RHS repeat-associated protein